VSAAVPAVARRRRVTYRRIYPYLLVAPALLVLVIVLLYPFVDGVWLSFHEDTQIGRAHV